eukprot:TRINITY_DN31578_c0_g1_i1.p1 TRINITY_DN31578_c0_g1~~TRINITY_DN31578_c0_g1_i1.p1  ORF type:complete len:608 (-),score=108.89 TRINITY_DN31578_c0_g1_i1:26-1849(-)
MAHVEAAGAARASPWEHWRPRLAALHADVTAASARASMAALPDGRTVAARRARIADEGEPQEAHGLGLLRPLALFVAGAAALTSAPQSLRVHSHGGRQRELSSAMSRPPGGAWSSGAAAAAGFGIPAGVPGTGRVLRSTHSGGRPPPLAAVVPGSAVAARGGRDEGAPRRGDAGGGLAVALPATAALVAFGLRWRGWRRRRKALVLHSRLLPISSRGGGAGDRHLRPSRSWGTLRAADASESGAADGRSRSGSASLASQATLFLTYFLLQSSMSFYMKWILSKIRVSEDLVGVPASFLVTASQQLVGLLFFALLVLTSWLLGRPYKPKKLKSLSDVLLVCALSLSFSLNIGLNLLSLSLVPLSLTMIIRACTPLSTACVQALLMRKHVDIALVEWALMVFGVLCAACAVIVQTGGLSGTSSASFFFGVAMSVLSLFSGALDFVFKGVLGADVKLNAVDTTCYMALPVALLTSVASVFWATPVPESWAMRFAPRMTNVAVFRHIWTVNPSIFGWIALSGMLAFAYNTFVTFLIVKLSPATAAFAGNFNKSATILFSLLLLEGALGAGSRGLLVLLAVLGNIAAFTLYSVLKKRREEAALDEVRMARGI